MAVKALRAAAVLTAVLSLGSCEVLALLFSSVFPASATLLKAQADLSGPIPSNSGNLFSVRVVESPPYGYVVVARYTASTGNTEFFYDLDLNPAKTLTGLTGSGVTADLSGKILAGNQILKAADLSTLGTASTTVNSNVGFQGNDGFITTTSNPNVVNLSMAAGSTISYTPCPASWGTASPVTSSPLSNTLSNLQIRAVLDDGLQTGNVVLVFGPPSSGDTTTCYFLTITKSQFTTSPSGIAALLLDSAPHRDGLETNTLGFAQGSVFAYEKSSSSFVRIDPATGSTQSTFSSQTDLSSVRFAYRASGGSFYSFDTNTRVLTKYTAWW